MESLNGKMFYVLGHSGCILIDFVDFHVYLSMLAGCVGGLFLGSLTEISTTVHSIGYSSGAVKVS